MAKIAIQELQMSDSIDLVKDLSVKELKALKGGTSECGEDEGYKKKEKEKDDEEKKKSYYYPPCYSPCHY